MIRLVYFQFIQLIRTPITFFWTIGLPTMLCIVFSYDYKQTLYQIGYIIVSIFLYGGIIPIIHQREIGFFKCIATNKNTILRYITSLYIVNLILMIISLVLYLVFSSFVQSIKFDFLTGIKILLISIPVSLLCFMSLFVITSLRIKVLDLITLSNVLIFSLLILAYSGDNILGGVLNGINIIFIINEIMFVYIEESVVPFSIAYLVALSFVGGYALLKFNRQPYEGR